MDQLYPALLQGGTIGTVATIILRLAIPYAARQWSKVSYNLDTISTASIALTQAASSLTSATEKLLILVDKLTTELK